MTNYLPKNCGAISSFKAAKLSDKQLIKISAQYNDLENLPSEIGYLHNLVNLILRGNKLTRIPKTIGKLEKLEELDLAVNNLTILPDTFGNLSNLSSLLLQSNYIETTNKLNEQNFSDHSSRFVINNSIPGG